MTKSDTWCPLPWMHFSSNTDGTIRICCNTDNGGFVRDDNNRLIHLSDIKRTDDYFNNTFMRNLRKEMVEGKRPKICSKCFIIEDSGGRSIRQDLNVRFNQDDYMEQTFASGALSNPKITYIDLAFGNKCNIKCRMCRPFASDQLIEEFRALKLEPGTFEREETMVERVWRFELIESLLDGMLDTADEMLITGGEPLVNEEHYKLLQLAVEKKVAKNILLRYHSNLTVWPERWVEIWKNFRAIELHGSIEAFGPLNDYIRYPSKWKVIEKNLKYILDSRSKIKLHLEIHTVWQIYNVLGVAQFLEYLVQYKDEIGVIPYFIYLTEPKYLDASLLPDEIKNTVEQSILNFLGKHGDLFEPTNKFADENHSRKENLLGCIEQMKDKVLPNKERLWKKFVEVCQKQDAYRKQNFLLLSPEFEQYFT